MKGTTSTIAALSVIVSLLIISSTFFTGMARGQLSDAGYSGSNYVDNYDTRAPYAGGSESGLAIPGMEGLQGFEPGENIMSLAVIPVSQQNNQLFFEIIGFTITSPVSGQSVVYSFSTPLPGVIDPAANTMQIDLSNIAAVIGQAGYIDSSQVYDVMRTDPRVVIINVDMNYQGFEASQTIFTVNGVDIIPPDGQVQSFALEQPTQLIIDAQNMRIYMVAFPQMINVINSYYGASYPQVLPIVYAQPVPVLPPVFVPYVQPVPIFLSSFIPFNPFFFGGGFRPFFNHRFHGGFPIHDRFFWRRGLNDFDRFRGGEFRSGDRNVFRGGDFGRGQFGRNEFDDRFRPGGGRDEFFRGGPGNRFTQDGNVFRQGGGRNQFGQGQGQGQGIGEFRRGTAGQAGFARPGTGDGGRISTPSVRSPAAGFQPGNVGGGNRFAGDGGTISVTSGRRPVTGGNRFTGGDGGRGIGSGGGITRGPAAGTGPPQRISAGGQGAGSGRFSSGSGRQINTPSFSGGNRIRTPSVSGGNRISAPSGGRISGGGIRAPAGPARASGGGAGENLRRR